MKRRKLKKSVVFIASILLMSLVIYSSYKVYEAVNKLEVIDNDTFKNYELKSRVVPTVAQSMKFIKPFVDERVSVRVPFYNVDDEDKKQQDALIYYENIYMPSTGIIYSCDEIFNVVSIYDGKVKDIRQDPIMGNIVEVVHNDSLTSVYQSLGDLSVSKGEEVSQGQVLGVASTNKIFDKYNLNLQLYKDGKLINPDIIYDKTIDDLNE